MAEDVLPITSYVHPYFSSHFQTPFLDNFHPIGSLSFFLLSAINLQFFFGVFLHFITGADIADLLQLGLPKASFIPDKARRELREPVGYRKSLLKKQTAELNRLQKVLEGANVKLSGTVSKINGKSGRNFLEALLTGKKMNMAKISEMRRDKRIAANLKSYKSSASLISKKFTSWAAHLENSR